MKMHWIVCDHAGDRSLKTIDGGRDTKVETFASFAGAEKRAQELAGYEPGGDIGIYQCVGFVRAPIGEARTVKWGVLDK